MGLPSRAKILGLQQARYITKALRDLPKEVVDIYAQVLKDIPEDDKETARSILIWLTYSVKPLTLEELASAGGIPSPQKVLDICTSSLISLQRNDMDNFDVVKFDHFSVKEYLTSESFRTSPETAFFYESPLIAHLTMAGECVSRFITINKFNLVTDKSTGSKVAENLDAELWPPGKDPLLSYSTGWYKHIQQADAIDRSKAQSAEIQQTSSVSRVQSHRLFREEFSQSFQNWCHLFLKEDHYVDGGYSRLCGEKTSPIIMASLAGLPNNVRRLLDDGVDVDEDVGNADSKQNSGHFLSSKITRPIHAAAISGNLETLRLLLEKGATLNQFELDMVAEENIRQGADVLSDILRDRPTLKITDNTVMASAANWYSKEILSYILDHENHLTQSQLVAIAKNYRTVDQDHEVIGKIIGYGERIGCDRAKMLIAFLRRSRCGHQIRTVLNLYQPPISMIDSILESVFGNHSGALRMLQFVFGYYKDVGFDIHISSGMLDEALKFHLSYMMFSVILGHAKTVVVGVDTLQGLEQTFNGTILMNLLMKHENCKYTKRARFMIPIPGYSSFRKHLSTCPVEITKKTLQLAAQLDETALATLRKNARPNVIFPSADEVKDLVEKRRSGTPQQTESTLTQMPSPEPAIVPQREDSE